MNTRAANEGTIKTGDALEMPSCLGRSAGVLLTMNLCLGILLLVETAWYFENVYPHKTVLLVPLAIFYKGILAFGGGMLINGIVQLPGVLRHPSRIATHKPIALFCQLRVVFGMAFIVSGVYVWIAANPILHLIYTTDVTSNELPIMQVGKAGGERQFHDTGIGGRISIRIEESDPQHDREPIAVVDVRKRYRVILSPAHYRTYWPFVGHRRVDVNGFVLRRKLAVKIQDTNSSEGWKEIPYGSSDKSLAEWCEGLELDTAIDVDKYKCAELLEKVFGRMTIDPRDPETQIGKGAVLVERCHEYAYHVNMAGSKEIKLILWTVRATRDRRTTCDNETKDRMLQTQLGGA